MALENTGDYVASLVGPGAIKLRKSISKDRAMFDSLKTMADITEIMVVMVLDAPIERYNSICLVPDKVSPDNLELIRQCILEAKSFIDNINNMTLEMFLANFQSKRSSSIESIKKEQDKTASAIEKALRNLKMAEDDHRRVQEKLEAAGKYNKTALDQSIQMNSGLQALLDNDYDIIKFAGDKVYAKTKEIAIEYDGIVYRLTPVEFEVYIREVPDIKVLVPSVDNLPSHPHVSSDGTVCRGNMKTAFIDCFTTEAVDIRLVDGLRLLANIFCHYNPNDRYNYIERCYSVGKERTDDNSWYTDCLKQVTPHIHCVAACSDKKCPSWASRFERCLDDINKREAWVTCLACKKCDKGVENARQRIS